MSGSAVRVSQSERTMAPEHPNRPYEGCTRGQFVPSARYPAITRLFPLRTDEIRYDLPRKLDRRPGRWINTMSDDCYVEYFSRRLAPRGPVASSA